MRLFAPILMMIIAEACLGCEPMPKIISSPQTSMELQFGIPVSKITLMQLVAMHKKTPNAETTRRLASAYYGNGKHQISESLMRAASVQFPQTELYLYAKIFLVGKTQIEAFQRAAILGDSEARRDFIKASENFKNVNFEVMFWQTQAWKESFDFFARCELALKSSSSMARKMCIQEIDDSSHLTENPELMTLGCHLKRTQQL
jgi:hypothetical protein